MCDKARGLHLTPLIIIVMSRCFYPNQGISILNSTKSFGVDQLAQNRITSRHRILESPCREGLYRCEYDCNQDKRDRVTHDILILTADSSPQQHPPISILSDSAISPCISNHNQLNLLALPLSLQAPHLTPTFSFPSSLVLSRSVASPSLSEHLLCPFFLS